MKTKKITKRTLFLFKNNNNKGVKLQSTTSSDPTNDTLTIGTTGIAIF